jgi:uncharacterized protein (TIGR00725 family)
MKKLRVSVFGGSKPVQGEPAYEQALQLGRLLAANGHIVLTGGYIGTMEAVSKGAAEGGGHVIGVTCGEIERWRPVNPNRWVMEEMRYPTLRQRLFALVENCDVAFALPGGAGTLAEIAVMWTHLLTGSIAPRPLILIWDGWKTTFETFFASLPEYIPDSERRWLLFQPTSTDAVQYLEKVAPVS